MMVACVTALSSARLTVISPEALVWTFIAVTCGMYTAVPVLQNCRNWLLEFGIVASMSLLRIAFGVSVSLLLRP